ncbi:MAG: 50S ribosomal protein L10 [Acidobacteria bacterium]|nr:MAG: 50S ribosomal protein L10 [Acidobacteriota bacterium]
MNKEEKQNQADALRQELERAKGVLLSGFEGLTVAQDTQLRDRIAKAGGKYRVVKNSLIERAAQGTPVAPVAQKLRGTTSLAYTETDPVAMAKIITAYAKEHPALVFKTGVVEGRVVALSLPSREALFSKVLFLINAPAQRLASTVAGVARNLAYVIQQGVQEKKFKQGSE